MQGDKVLVTGLGIVSAIGNNVDETLEALMHQRTGIGLLKHIQSRYKGSLPVGEVPYTDDELKVMAGVDKDGLYHTRTDLLGILAVKEAIESAGIKDIHEWRTGLISATSVGGMGITENKWLDYLDTEKSGDWLNYIHTHECGDSTETIAQAVGIDAYVSTISTACSSSANSIMFGARMIKAGLLDRVIVGGTDSLSKFTINGFMTLMILDSQQCQPFDSERRGLNLGEGAGFIVLESEAAAAGKPIVCELSGYGNANDAYHQTASSPTGEGAVLAIKKALASAGLHPRDIDYINAHGTGTEINDLSEGNAIERIFGNHVPHVSSTKSFTGHTLGACGGIEAVFSALAIQNNLVFPNLNHKTQMSELDFKVTTDLLENHTIRHVLSNSFGFGGNTSALLFSKHKA